MKCFDLYSKCDVPCQLKSCRQWMEYEGDLNCAIIAVHKNGCKSMTLREVGERLGVSFVRIKQIEDKVLDKIKKKKMSLD